MKIIPRPLSLLTQFEKVQKTHSVPTSNARVERPVQLSSTLMTARKQLAVMPDVDLEKVNKMKKALADGSFEVCVDSLADSMQQFYKA